MQMIPRRAFVLTVWRGQLDQSDCDRQCRRRGGNMPIGTELLQEYRRTRNSTPIVQDFRLYLAWPAVQEPGLRRFGA